ncbi:hypothetical protein WMY93_011163 [Mugilogobius chulae]|uniref:Protein kinase domain-containing protein n=1 Tax=Mugilogobius chulae TaxID=88201 RepID=A0AAW0P166_9GOBI
MDPGREEHRLQLEQQTSNMKEHHDKNSRKELPSLHPGQHVTKKRKHGTQQLLWKKAMSREATLSKHPTGTTSDAAEAIYENFSNQPHRTTPREFNFRANTAKAATLYRERSNFANDSFSTTVEQTKTMTTPTLTEEEIKKTLPENYQFVQILEAGGFGQVVKCRTKDTDQAVAVKIPLYRQDTNNEIAMLRQMMDQRMDQRNIVKFYEDFDTPTGKAMIFEMLDMSLLDYVNQHYPLSFSEIRNIIKQVATALQALKDLSYIHCDLKTENVMVVDRTQRPVQFKLIDFGLSIPASQAVVGTRIQHVCYRHDPQEELSLDRPGKFGQLFSDYCFCFCPRLSPRQSGQEQNLLWSKWMKNSAPKHQVLQAFGDVSLTAVSTAPEKIILRSIDNFVINTLTHWQLTDLIESFKEHFQGGRWACRLQSTGFLEERLCNVRKKLRSISRSRSTTQGLSYPVKLENSL